MIKLKILRWEVDPGLSGWTQYNQKGPHRKETEESERRWKERSERAEDMSFWL